LKFGPTAQPAITMAASTPSAVARDGHIDPFAGRVLNMDGKNDTCGFLAQELFAENIFT
jgi:hypothetical protein